jgi:hypothetical protein
MDVLRCDYLDAIPQNYSFFHDDEVLVRLPWKVIKKFGKIKNSS